MFLLKILKKNSILKSLFTLSYSILFVFSSHLLEAKGCGKNSATFIKKGKSRSFSVDHSSGLSWCNRSIKKGSLPLEKIGQVRVDQKEKKILIELLESHKTSLLQKTREAGSFMELSGNHPDLRKFAAKIIKSKILKILGQPYSQEKAIENIKNIIKAISKSPSSNLNKELDGERNLLYDLVDLFALFQIYKDNKTKKIKFLPVGRIDSKTLIKISGKFSGENINQATLYLIADHIAHEKISSIRFSKLFSPIDAFNEMIQNKISPKSKQP